MLSRTLQQLVSVGVLLALTHSWALGAPACKGPNKYSDGCPAAEEPVAAVASPVVDSTTVDWANEKIIVRGSDLDTVTAFTLGGSVLVAIGATSPTEVELLFDNTMAGEVAGVGSYSLKADGTDAISIHFISSVVDPAGIACPCELDWAAELGVGVLWGAEKTTACYEITSPGVADLAGIVLTDPNDPSVYPQYPIGASYYAADPVSSSCRLIQINDADPFQQEVVNIRINANQQADCAVALQFYICATTEPSVIP
jgi:hypothetical protein